LDYVLKMELPIPRRRSSADILGADAETIITAPDLVNPVKLPADEKTVRLQNGGSRSERRRRCLL